MIDKVSYDYGVDFDVELKTPESFVTSFNFRVQLKAIDKLEERAENKDGSFSIQVESSNINYLLSRLSMYILYVKSQDRF